MKIGRLEVVRVMKSVLVRRMGLLLSSDPTRTVSSMIYGVLGR